MLNRADTKFSLFLLVREVSLRPGLLSKLFRYLHGDGSGLPTVPMTTSQTLQTFFDNVLHMILVTALIPKWTFPFWT